MLGCDNERPQVSAIEPMRQLASEHPTALTGTSAGDDLDAAQPVGAGANQKRVQLRQRCVGRLAMQVKTSRRQKTPVGERSPARVVETKAAVTDDEFHCGRFLARRCRDLGPGKRGWSRTGRIRMWCWIWAVAQWFDVPDVAEPRVPVVFRQTAGSAWHNVD